jgi:membrane-bound lytic murein transglycosylase D
VPVKEKIMILRASKYAVLLFVFLSFGCSFHKTPALQLQSPGVPESRQLESDEENRQIAEITPVDVSADEVSEENGGIITYYDGIDPDTPALGDSREILSASPLPEETPEKDNTAPVESAEVLEIEEDQFDGQDLLDSALDYVTSSQGFWSEGNPDKAIATLDEAYSLVIKVDTDENPELIQQKEDLRYMISKRILEIYASRYTATNGNHNEIPLTLNEYVEKEIKNFQGPGRAYFLESYRRSGRYMPMILQALREAGLPEDLAWLPIIESGFKVNALSKARALGLWQFMASTGQKFGLERDTYVDERLDPEKSTAAAIAYLKELHQIFGDWTTVLAGYNCGEGTVLKKIRSQKINYLDNFWDLFQLLPYETARYVPKFLATLHILKDPVKYSFDLEEPDSPDKYETVTVQKPVRLSALAAAIAVSEEDLIALNPELRQKATPPTTYLLKIPEGKTEALLARIQDIPSWSPPEYAYHKVRQGESLSVIAQKYHSSVSRIVLINNIRKRDLIRAGQTLKVPLRGTAERSTPAASGAELLPGGKYRVQEGDSLWLISRRFNTDTKKIQQVNNLKNTLLRVGQILIIPQ